MSNKKILRDISHMVTATYLSKFLFLIRAFIVARLLGPSLFGIWKALQVIQIYSGHSHLGTLSAMNREIPFFVGKGNKEKVGEIRDIVFGTSFFVSLFVAVVILFVTFFIRDAYPKMVIFGLVAISFLVVFYQVHLFFNVFMSSQKKFRLRSRATFIYALIDFVLVISLVYFYQLYGFFLGMILSYFLILIYIKRQLNYNFVVKFDLKENIRLIKIGAPIIMIGFLSGLLLTIDRMVITFFLGTTFLGFYSLALMMVEFIKQIPLTIAQVLSPNLYHRFGEKENIKSIKQYVMKPMFLFAYTMPCFLLFISIITPLLVKLILPDYIKGVVVAQILILIMYFHSLNPLGGSFFVALNKQHKLIPIFIFSILLSIILNIIFVKMGYGINGVAVATALTYFIHSTIILVYTIKHFIKGVMSYLNLFCEVYLPFIFNILVVFILYGLFNYNIFIIDDILQLTIILVGIGLLNIPFLFMLNKRVNLVSYIKLFLARTR